MQFHYFFDNRQPNTKSGVLRNTQRFRLSKQDENQWQRLRGDSNAIVLDSNDRFIALIRDLEPDPSALGRKLAGVLKEIDESLPQALGIGVDPDDSRRLNEVEVLS